MILVLYEISRGKLIKGTLGALGAAGAAYGAYKSYKHGEDIIGSLAAAKAKDEYENSIFGKIAKYTGIRLNEPDYEKVKKTAISKVPVYKILGVGALDYARQLLNKGEDAAEELMNKAKPVAKTIKSKVEEAPEKAKSLISKIKSQVQNRAETGESKIAGLLKAPSETGLLKAPSETGLLKAPSETGLLKAPSKISGAPSDEELIKIAAKSGDASVRAGVAAAIKNEEKNKELVNKIIKNAIKAGKIKP